MTEHRRHNPEGSRGCAGCGDCCDNLTLGWDLTNALAWTTSTDPADDTAWEGWQAVGWTEEKRGKAQERRQAALDSENLAFAAEHWTVQWKENNRYWRVTCDQYDPDRRTCTAGETRPPICRDYPWYGETPKAGELRTVVARGPGGVGLACSYLGDVPAAERPGEYPLLPIWPI